MNRLQPTLNSRRALLIGFVRLTGPGRGRSQGGFALLVVILVMLLVSLIASQLVLDVRSELKVSSNVKARVSAGFLAEAGLRLGLFRLLDRSLDIPEIGDEEDWQNFYEGYEYELYLDKGKVTYYTVSETGKIDLNRSPDQLIRLFLEYQLGLGEEEGIATIIDSIIDSIKDWRDSDDMYRLNGAESEYYTNLEDPYIARNGKIEEPAEFFLINGTEPLAGKFPAQDIFTVHNIKGKINFNSLPPAMLNFLTGGDKEKILAYKEAKKTFNGKLSAVLALEILGEEYEKFRPFLVYSSSNNRYYSIVGTGAAGRGRESEELEQAEAEKRGPVTLHSLLIKKNGSRFNSLAWQERYK